MVVPKFIAKGLWLLVKRKTFNYDNLTELLSDRPVIRTPLVLMQQKFISYWPRLSCLSSEKQQLDNNRKAGLRGLAFTKSSLRTGMVLAQSDGAKGGLFSNFTEGQYFALLKSKLQGAHALVQSKDIEYQRSRSK